jgi:hypothetical protein
MDSNQAILITELFLCWILKSAQKTESGPQNWHTEAYRLIFFDNIIHSKWFEDQINFFFLTLPSKWQADGNLQYPGFQYHSNSMHEHCERNILGHNYEGNLSPTLPLISTSTNMTCLRETTKQHIYR